MFVTSQNLLSSAAVLALGLQICASSPVLAMDYDGLPKAPAAKAATSLPQDSVRKAMTSGYFVHAFPQNLSQYDWTLRAGTMIPVTVDMGGMGAMLLSALDGVMSAADTQKVRGIMRGVGSNPVTTFQVNPDGFRPCLYFTLNSILEPHAASNVSAYTSAVLIPAGELLHDVVNMSPRDMAVWRAEIDLRKIPGAMLVVPEEQAKGVSHPSGLTVYSYKTGRTLSGSVKALLKSKGVEGIVLQDAPQGQETYLDKALVGGVNIETVEAFSELLGNPGISFGHEKGPKRAGLGTYIGILQPFAENVNKLCARGFYSKGTSQIPSHYSKYRPEPYLQLAAVALEEMGSLIERLGNQSILDDFTTVQREKMEQVLRALDEFIQDHQSSPEWEKKLYTSDISLRLADMPYEVARRVLDHVSLAPVKEEMETLYWVCRWNQAFPAYGVQAPDSLDVLTQLEAAAGRLRAKLEAGGYSWFYAQYLNHLLAIYVPGQLVEGFADHYVQALGAIRTTLPQRGWIKVKCGAASVGKVMWKDTLSRFRLELPKDLLAAGLKDTPVLQTPRAQQDAY